MTRTLAIVAILATLLLAQFIGADHPVVASADNAAVVRAPTATTVEVSQRALEDLAAWPGVDAGLSVKP